MDELDKALRDTLLWLTSIPSPIGEEKALCDAVQQRLMRMLKAALITRDGDSLVVQVAPAAQGPRIGLVGHLDTVRTQHDGPVRIEGDRLYGPGAADMKSGLAVMIELAERLSLADQLACNLTLVFYEREEGPYDENRLGPLLERFETLRNLDLAICLEPSDNKLQLGCMGSLHAIVVFHGRSAHSARPWQGENALYLALPLLSELAARTANEVGVDDMIYRETIVPTLARAGRGRNIVPDEFELNINYRFAPPKTPEQAAEELTKFVADRARVTPIDLSPAGRPHRHHPLVERLVACGVRAIEPKQAWTDVARFDQIGVAAVNFGPGTQAQAHQRNEYTELPKLSEGYAILNGFLSHPKQD